MREGEEKKESIFNFKTHKPPIFLPNKGSDYRIIDFFDLNPSLTVIFINGFFPSDVVMWMRNHMNINDIWHSRVTKITQHAEAKLTQNNQKNVTYHVFLIPQKPCRYGQNLKKGYKLDTVTDFLIKLGIKQCMHILKISIFY